MPRKAPVSRRDRPAKPALTLDGIVATALRVMSEEDLSRVTMRRLAQELDTGPASLYVYVDNTDDLHGLMLDVLLAEVDTDDPGAGAGDWRERLWALVRSYTSVLLAHPALARVALVTRLSGTHYMDVVDAALGLLLAGDAAPERASWAVDTLLLMATATAVEHGARTEMPAATAQHDKLVAAIDDVSPARHPHIAAVGRELVSGSGLDRSRWAFDVVVNGALATPRP